VSRNGTALPERLVDSERAPAFRALVDLETERDELVARIEALQRRVAELRAHLLGEIRALAAELDVQLVDLADRPNPRPRRR
jgi:hypothetical protein